jgi:tRNA A37 methylthiotransferase MiaB
VEKIKFDSVSVFGYHDEILASSSKLNNKVSEKIIIERVKRLKKVLNEIYKMKDKKQKIKVKV